MPKQIDADNQSGGSRDSPIDPLVKAYIDAQIEKANEHEDTPRKKKWKNSWRAASPITKGTFIITCAIGAATICYAIIAAFQLCAMTGQLAQMKLDSDNSGKQFQAQLAHFDDGLGRTGLLAAHAGEQAVAAKDAADAAKSAADTAKEALQVSERAYIYTGTPDVDFVTRQLTVPLINGGHIPSGPVRILAYEVTLSPLLNGPKTIQGTISEKHWRSAHLKSITTSPSVNYAVNIPLLDQALFNKGQQGFAVAGEISYNDGFPHTPLQVRQFCFLTRQGDKADSMKLIGCDPDTTLPWIKSVVQYPANEENSQR